jgi:hypothetical protein
MIDYFISGLKIVQSGTISLGEGCVSGFKAKPAPYNPFSFQLQLKKDNLKSFCIQKQTINSRWTFKSSTVSPKKEQATLF